MRKPQTAGPPCVITNCSTPQAADAQHANRRWSERWRARTLFAARRAAATTRARPKEGLGTIPPHYTRAARRSPPCTRHPTPLAGRRLAISPCHLVVSWTWLRGGLGLGVLGEGMATKAKGRPRMAASPAQKKSRRGSKGAFVERTHLAAEHSGRHELQSMILMRLVNNPYCTRSGT